MRTIPDIARFNSMRLPSTDFNAVRDDVAIPYLFYELDLSVPRSIAAGTQIVLQLKGNSIYIDQNSDVGAATIVFHDQSLTAKPGKVYVQPGFNAQIPFDVLTIENLGQPGKVLRIFYGVDIDFKPGVNGILIINGVVSTSEQGSLYGVAFSSNGVLANNQNEAIVNAAPNVNGIVITRASAYSTTTPGPPFIVLLAKAGAPPTSAIDGDVLLAPEGFAAIGANFSLTSKLDFPIRVAPGKGLYWRNAGTLELGGLRSVLYTLL